MKFLALPISGARGFSLIEMLVVLAIISVVTTITLLSNNSFSRSILLVDTAHTVALSIREAQFFGLSTRIFSGVSNAGYGIHFAEGEPTRYTLFADINPEAPGDDLNGNCPGHPDEDTPDMRPGNCRYDALSNERVNDYNLRGNFSIASVCGKISQVAQRCIGEDFDSIDITFLRPNTDTIIVGWNGGSNTALLDACIAIQSPTSEQTQKFVYVSRVGQVAVVNECP